MASRSLGTLTVDVVAQEGGFTAGMDRVERKAELTYKQVEDAAKRRAKGTEQAWKQANANIEKQFEGMSEAQYKNNMRMVPAQITDIAVSLQGGQAPLTVLLQQGGQLRDMFGSVGGAARALGAGLLGLVSPFSVVAAAVAVLVAGYVKGEAESKAFNVAIQTTGNQAGTTVSQLSDMASAMDRIGGVTQSGAADALALFATSAGVGSDRLERYTATALAWEKATGQAAEEVAKNFKKIADDPVQGLLEVNKQMGFLTSATFEQVKALQEAGRETDAARVAQDAYDRAAATAATNITQNLGYVERAWRAIKGASAEAIDAIANVGRQAGIGQQLAENTVRMAELQSKGVRLANDLSEVSNYAERDLFNLKQKEIQLQKNLAGERKTVEEQKKYQDTQSDLISLSQEATKYADRETKKRQELAAAEAKYGELAKTNAKAAIQLAQVRAGIEDKYKAPKGAKTQTDKEADAAKSFLRTMEEQALKVQERTAYEKLGNDIKLRGLKLSDSQLGRAQGLATAIDMAKEAEEQRASALIRNNTQYELQNRLLAQGAEYQAELSRFGMGDRESGVLRERMALLEKQNEEIRKMERDQANALSGAKSDGELEQLQANFAVRMELTKEALGKELQMFDDFQTEKAAKEKDAASGVEAAMKTYVENAQNTYALAEKSTASLFGSMEDAMVSFVQTGKIGFADFANSVIADLARIAARQAISGLVDSLGGGVSSFIGGLFGGGRASGGQVSAGKVYQVAENGPEMLSVGGKSMLLMGNQAGSIHNGQRSAGGSGGGGLTVNVPIAMDLGGGRSADPSTLENVGTQLSKAIKPAVQEEVARMMRPGGLLWSQSNGR